MNAYTIPVADLPKLKDVIPEKHQHRSVILKNGAIAHYYDNPGKNIPATTREAIYKTLVPVTSFAFAADMTGYWKNRRENGYFEKSTEFVLVTTAQGHIIAWSGFSAIVDPSCTIIYNDSSGVIPPYQGQAMMGEIFQARINACLQKFSQKNIPLYFSTRTESPVIYKMR